MVCWFYPDTITTVWAGNDKNYAVAGHRATGGVVAAGIWHKYMTAYYNSHKLPKQRTFTKPERRLLVSLPRYGDDVLLSGVFADGDQVLQAVPNDLRQLEYELAEGIGSAYKVQKLEAIKRGANTAVATATPTLGMPGYSSVQASGVPLAYASPRAYAPRKTIAHPSGTPPPNEVVFVGNEVITSNDGAPIPGAEPAQLQATSNYARNY